MNPIHALLSTSLLLAAALPRCLPAQELRDPQEQKPPADYVVHEWGTFTSMAGTGGAVLEGLHHEEEHLPGFVHDLMKVEETGFTRKTKMPASYVTQKMETPVIYFYADEQMRAQVRVWFTNGLMTQFYPLPSTVYPRIAAARRQLVDMTQVRGSMLSWDVDILPRGTPLPAGGPRVPEVGDDDPWHFARQTSANLVRTRPDAKSKAKPEVEHYLFYRGLGRWQPELEAGALRGGRLRFHNRMPHGIPFCMALQLGEQGGRFVVGAPLGGHATATFALAAGGWHGDRERFARRVGAVVLAALVEQGLYVDEARAMVATWSRSWFQSDGTRVIYLLPRPVVDQVLPLSLDPKPKELVRVMVGRHELITPEAQESVERALSAGDEATLAQLDRFLEPHLRNVMRNGSTTACRDAAEARLAAMTR